MRASLSRQISLPPRYRVSTRNLDASPTMHRSYKMRQASDVGTSRSEAGTRKTTPSNELIRSQFESLMSEGSDEEDDLATRERGGREDTDERNFAEAAVSEDADQIILSMIWNKNHLGAASYNAATSELLVLEDTIDDAEYFDVTKALYKQCLPRYVLLSASAPTVFKNVVKKMLMTEASAEESSSFASRGNSLLKFSCRKEHSYERCSHRVRCLRLESEPKNATNAERLTFLNSLLNFKCCAMIHALGSLLLFVDRHWTNIVLDAVAKPSFVSLNYVTLRDLVTVDEDTYKALNIVQARDHPSLFKFGKTITTTKGVSLFSLLNRYCHSKPGVQFLWKTLHYPTRNIDVLEQRLNAIQFFQDPNNQSVVENLSSCLRHVYVLTNAVIACCSGPQASASSWYKLHKTVSHVLYIADICEDFADRIGLFKRIAESVTAEMQYVKYFIEYIVDFAESRRERRLVVKSNVDPLLDELNHARRALPQLLTRMGEKDMREYLPDSVTGCNMLYLPNIGYVLAINKWNPTPPEDFTFPDLEFKFSINQVHYYKSRSAKELDETVGDIILKIAVRQNHIVQKLIRYTRRHTGAILNSIQLCAELDTLLAFYKVAYDYGYARPKLTESKMIEVVEGRHPLMECAGTFVPNDIRSGNGSSLVKLLTGPNSCGKSIYLKQIGLTVFMAHIGCYVPAKSATIGTVSRILTQMSSTESVGLNASSFLQSLRQINVALCASTSDSVVITDELDRGTCEVSGVSLVAAVLNAFAERGAACPHVFAATHAYSVFALLPRSPIIQVQTFEYTIDEDESLTFLYHLINGSATRSFAHYVARIAELDEEIVKRGLHVYEKVKQHELPSSIYPRFDRMKLLASRLETDRDLDLDTLKMLVQQVVLRK